MNRVEQDIYETKRNFISETGIAPNTVFMDTPIYDRLLLEFRDFMRTCKADSNDNTIYGLKIKILKLTQPLFVGYVKENL